MFRMPSVGKAVIAAAALAASIAAVQPASAQPYRWGPHPGFGHHYGWRHRAFVGPRHCVVRRAWVRTPFGPRPVVRRVCF